MPPLSKVYGSVLQPRDTLPVQACANCDTPFAPTTSTIYPDPYGATTDGPPRFFCRSCFIANGGSRGPCAECSRPVLILKSEGGFVHAGDRYWHKKCFNCSGCDKSIGDAPMLDLLGRPTCAECFDTCLERDPTTPKKNASATNSPRVDKLSGSSKRQSREGSPALEELEQRLGIVKTREPSPALEELSYRLSMIGKDSPTRSPLASSGSRYSSRETSPLVIRSRTKSDPAIRPFDDSPSRRYERFRSPEPDEHGGSPSPLKRYSTSGTSSPLRDSPTRAKEEAIEEMKSRFMKSSSASPAASTSSTPPLSKPRLRSSRSSGRLSTPSTPDLTSDSSDATSSVGPDSPPRDVGAGYDVDVFSASKVAYGSRHAHLLGSEDIIAEETSSQLNTPAHTPKSSVKAKATPVKSPIPFSTTTPSKSPKTPSKSLSTTPTKTPSKSPKALAIAPVTESTTCVKCLQSLFSVSEGGRYVTVTNELSGEPETYHSRCFTCVLCHLPFKEGAAGQALFVKGVDGPAHVECAPPQKIVVTTKPTTVFPAASIFSHKAPSTTTTKPAVESRENKFEKPPLTAPPTSTPMTFPRFGGSNACPGCNISVSPMERGVVPGPHGSRWHASCLVCGGKKPPVRSWALRDEKKKGVPGCGKKLDSAAKRDNDGRVWCRECSLLLPMEMRSSPQTSPARTPIVPTHTGSSGKIVPQTTGTTIARQFTGYGNDPGLYRQLTGGARSVSPSKGMFASSGDPGLVRQLTGGGGLSPTRSISPTKGLTGALRPRPKSVVGIRSTNIVRQMTGGSGN
ncbi:hypothetical protein HMN09_00646500 [Mycena chlorophos]|uniref:LIM zinc-binding domain-containing protein n=1 Tax=Mycena chlorophos TaxID=658473 RepID=A0A8H6T4U6_MYCCL|nr:hypothetical protein HMN09_00646500 [Mycena chlorophos]